MASDKVVERRAKQNGQSEGRKWKQQLAAGAADWTSADPNLVVAAVATVATMGGALRLGYTRDGGAYAIGVYGDGQPFTIYVRPSEEIDDSLGELIRTYGTDLTVSWLAEYMAKRGR